MQKFVLCFAIFLSTCSFIRSEEAKRVLIVGGAGYIGSHVNEMLHRQGYETVVLDNLSRGHAETVLRGDFIEGEMADRALLYEIFTKYKIDAVMHFAACMEVGESVEKPLLYYQNNVSNTITLLEAMHRHRVNIFIFSSSAAVYGEPEVECIGEDQSCAPINPYGQSKLMVEKILQDLSNSTDFQYCALRYFNAAGGDPLGELKNHRDRESNLIPIVLQQLKKGKNQAYIFGTDYPTPDGTCIRDYIHIDDLGDAHISAMEALMEGAPSGSYNLGNGQGFSVREVLDVIEVVTGLNLEIIESDRRPGDPPVLVASSQKAKKELKWKPKYSKLDEIVKHAWEALQDG